MGVPYFVDDGPPRRVWGIDDKESETMTTEITWEQKFAALQGLGEASLKMHAPGAWSVAQPGVEVKRSDKTLGEATAEGKTPEDAVEKRWAHLTSTSDKQFVEHKRGRLLRRVRWTGWFWADLPIDADAESSAVTA